MNTSFLLARTDEDSATGTATIDAASAPGIIHDRRRPNRGPHRSIPAIRVEEVTDPSRLDAYREQWDALIVRSPEASMFDTFEWVTSWIEAFWKDRPIRFMFFWRGDVLQGIAPLLLDKRGEVACPSSLICPVNTHGNRANVICAESPKAVYEALLAHLRQDRKTVRLAFRSVLATATLPSLLPEVAKAAGVSSGVYPSISSPIVRVSGDWQSYLKSRSSHLAKEVKRKVKQFQKAGHVEITVASRAEDCDKAMRDMLDIDKRSWKAEKDVSLDRVPGAMRLYENFAQAGAVTGLLRAYFLYLDSKPVAYVYGGVFHNEYYALRTSYDSEYKRLSPGIVIFDRILGDAFEQGRDVVDFGPGDESRWKHDFANDVRTQVDMCMFSPWAIRCRCCCVFQQRLKPLIKKHLPALVRIKRQLCHDA